MSTRDHDTDQRLGISLGHLPHNARGHHCHVAILPEDDGSFSAIVLNLPGVGSCGATEAEAIVNLRDAATQAIASYLESQLEIPWEASYQIPPAQSTSWIVVDG